jgi:hypothetical protein
MFDLETSGGISRQRIIVLRQDCKAEAADRYYNE